MNPNSSPHTWAGASSSSNSSYNNNPIQQQQQEQQFFQQAQILPSQATPHNPQQQQRQQQQQDQETSYGFVKEKEDAILLAEACVAGTLKPVSDLQTSGFSSLAMRSGTILVFVENSAQMQKMRFRDAGAWSSSRISGAFLLYRQVEYTDKKKTVAVAEAERSSLFVNTSLRPYTKLISNGLAKRTITIPGSDGNRYRVINYFYPHEVEGFYKKGGASSWYSLPIPSQQPEFDQFKHLLAKGPTASSSSSTVRSSRSSKSSRQSSRNPSDSPVLLVSASGSPKQSQAFIPDWQQTIGTSSSRSSSITDLVSSPAEQPRHQPHQSPYYQPPKSYSSSYLPQAFQHHQHPQQQHQQPQQQTQWHIPLSSQAHAPIAQSQFVSNEGQSLHSAMMTNRYDIESMGTRNTNVREMAMFQLNPPQWLNEPAILPPLRNLLPQPDYIQQHIQEREEKETDEREH
ncbi:UNVERIFIED_CONTAM: hypothetical protein HDU68_005432 [Siphonaria sp. JEL0065]|nr:hypothetical protein HDU68_005432 [Siphonaria sp. JEL0065]